MSNRQQLSTIRAMLHCAQSDLRKIERTIIGIAPAGDVGRATDHLQSAIGLLTDALTYDVDQSATEAMAAAS